MLSGSYVQLCVGECGWMWSTCCMIVLQSNPHVNGKLFERSSNNRRSCHIWMWDELKCPFINTTRHVPNGFIWTAFKLDFILQHQIYKSGYYYKPCCIRGLIILKLLMFRIGLLFSFSQQVWSGLQLCHYHLEWQKLELLKMKTILWMIRASPVFFEPFSWLRKRLQHRLDNMSNNIMLQ